MHTLPFDFSLGNMQWRCLNTKMPLCGLYIAHARTSHFIDRQSRYQIAIFGASAVRDAATNAPIVSSRLPSMVDSMCFPVSDC